MSSLATSGKLLSFDVGATGTRRTNVNSFPEQFNAETAWHPAPIPLAPVTKKFLRPAVVGVPFFPCLNSHPLESIPSNFTPFGFNPTFKPVPAVDAGPPLGGHSTSGQKITR